METLTRRQAAEKLGVADTYLIYWEKKGKLKPDNVRIGKIKLKAYSPELIEQAKKILHRSKRPKKGENHGDSKQERRQTKSCL